METSFAGQDLFKNNQYFFDQETYFNKQFAGFTTANEFTGFKTSCRNCEKLFFLNKKLYKHLQAGCTRGTYITTRSAAKRPSTELAVSDHKKLVTPLINEKTTTLKLSDNQSSIPIIKSTVSRADLGSGFAFRNWNYIIVAVNFRNKDFTKSQSHKNLMIVPNSKYVVNSKLAKSPYNGCMDLGCGATLIDKQWLSDQLPDAKPLCMALPLKIQGIGSSKHKTYKYVVKLLYFSATDDNGKQIVLCL